MRISYRNSVCPPVRPSVTTYRSREQKFQKVPEHCSYRFNHILYWYQKCRNSETVWNVYDYQTISSWYGWTNLLFTFNLFTDILDAFAITNASAFHVLKLRSTVSRRFLRQLRRYTETLNKPSTQSQKKNSEKKTLFPDIKFRRRILKKKHILHTPTGKCSKL